MSPDSAGQPHDQDGFPDSGGRITVAQALAVLQRIVTTPRGREALKVVQEEAFGRDGRAARTSADIAQGQAQREGISQAQTATGPTRTQREQEAARRKERVRRRFAGR
jgi:hypothetical protein